MNWIALGKTLINFKGEFHSQFGADPCDVVITWNEIKKIETRVPIKPIHLLWSLYFLKTGYRTWEIGSGILHTSTPTLKKYTENTIYLIASICCFNFTELAPKRSGIVGIVDTTSCPITAPYYNPWEYWDSHHYCYAVKYQVVCSFPLNNSSIIIDVKGPFKGRAHDKTIAIDTIIPLLKKSEILIGDGLYNNHHHFLVGITDKAKKQMTPMERKIGKMVHSVRQNVERIYNRIREFRCFDQMWHYSWTLHKHSFLAASYLTNLKLKRKPLDTL